MPNTKRESEQWAKAVFERCVALDLAANVTDDAAKPRAQKLQFPPGAFELVGMRVAPHHDGGPLGHPQIALAQLNALRCHSFKSNRQKECVQMPGKMARSDPRPSVRVTRGAGSGQHLASVLQEGRENANIDVGLGFIWRISVY